MNDDVLIGAFLGWLCGLATIVLIMLLLHNPALFFGMIIGGTLGWFFYSAFTIPSFRDIDNHHSRYH